MILNKFNVCQNRFSKRGKKSIATRARKGVDQAFRSLRFMEP